MKYALMPFRALILWIWNIALGIDQLAAASLGFNVDWTISAAVGWMEYNDSRIGKALALVINAIVFAFTFQWQHCRRAYLADQFEHPPTIWQSCWVEAKR